MGHWEDHWIHIGKRLLQWDILMEFARGQAHTELLLECAWKVSDWPSMKEALVKYASHPDSPLLKIYQWYQLFPGFIVFVAVAYEFIPTSPPHSYMAVHEGKPLEVESLCNQAIQLSLQQWQTLPPLPGAVHIPLLQTFQQLVPTILPQSTNACADHGHSLCC